jgi:CubicO group peptidase (beta-lactamase class C family)
VIRPAALVLVLAAAAGPALAAPDEQVLGKPAGYPVCNPFQAQPRTECLVGALSRLDTLYPARPVRKGPAVRELKRAAKEPPITWRTGIPPAPLSEPKTIDDFMATNRNTGLLVMRDDLILVERYQYDRKAEDRFQSFSMAKTVVAMLIGIAVSESKIKSIDDRAEAYVPALKGHPYGETSLRHLLTMSSGVRFTERYDGKDDVAILGAKTVGQQGPGGAESVLGFRTRELPAGTKFDYSSAETQVLGLVLRAAVGQPLVQYLSEKIWQPMGAEDDATWQVDAAGIETGFMGINARLRDWGRFGMLLANDGRMDGKQVIPAEWVRAATTAESPHLHVRVATKYNGYGYQTWLISHPRGGGDLRGGDRHMFAALGVRGQAIFVDPQSKLVVVHTGVYEMGPEHRGPQFALFFSTLRSLSQHMSNP